MSTFLLKTTIKGKGVKAALRSFESELKKEKMILIIGQKIFMTHFLMMQ